MADDYVTEQLNRQNALRELEEAITNCLNAGVTEEKIQEFVKEFISENI